MNMHNVPALPKKISDVVDEYDEKIEASEGEINTLKAAIATFQANVTICGRYVGRVSQHDVPDLKKVHHSLRKSAWREIYAGLNIEKLATAAERKKFDMALEDPPELTIGNVAATFGHYVQDPRFHILRALAEVFSNLDPAFKSHSNVKIGVSRLPKRVIIRYVDQYLTSHGAERLKDTLNAIRVFEGQPHLEYAEYRNFMEEARREGEADCGDGLRIKVYQNGNGHLFFDKHALNSVNRALAEFYGDVLPDTPDEDGGDRDLFTGRNVSKDLQYYPTPEAVADKLVYDMQLEDGDRILEPSCGDGRLLSALRRRVDAINKERRRQSWQPVEKQQPIKVGALGVEVHPDRAQQARDLGFKVICENFLMCEPDPVFDRVLINPPFYGQHWKKHIRHALRFCKPLEHSWNGSTSKRVHAILPASALVDGHLEEFDYGEWHDLPTASFHESGTNIAIGYVTIYGEKK